MIKKSSLLGTLLLAAIVAAVPVANAQTVHVVGASGSSQFLQSAIGADALALTEIANNVANSTWTPGQQATFHWTGKNAGYALDNRDTLGRILPENGNLFIVWIAAASDPTGNTDVTDIWTAVSLDATTAVRLFSAQETSGSGGQLYLVPGVTGNLVATSLWPDATADVTTLVNAPNVSAAIGTSPTGTGDLHFNVAFTDLRPEDALAATTRALGALNTTTWAGLGYVGPTANIGAPIYSEISTAAATPIKFSLSGKADPITKIDVPAYTTIPVGAGTFIFILNNDGVYSPSTSNFITGVGTTGPYPLAHLFDGTTTADTDNAAFGGPADGNGTPLTLFLREPISAAADVVEFSEFRSSGNTKDSQETGVINPTRAPYNPLNLPTAIHGVRQRALSTSEVIGGPAKGTALAFGLYGTPNSIGYIAFSFANAAKLTPLTSFNYLTLDGVDPLAIPGTNNQELPTIAATSQAAVWGAGNPSYPNLRNGTYKLCAVVRYLVPTAIIGTDPYGPDVLAQSEQDNVDATEADFVPFYTTGGTDGLDVYRSHFTVDGVVGNNGAATLANQENNGNTLGGVTEAGGDVGGLIEGPFGISIPTTTGTATVHTTLTKGKGYEVLYKTGQHFTAGKTWEGGSITIGGNPYTIANVATTATILYVTTEPGTTNDAVLPFVADEPFTEAAAKAPGVLSKHQ